MARENSGLVLEEEFLVEVVKSLGCGVGSVSVAEELDLATPKKNRS